MEKQKMKYGQKSGSQIGWKKGGRGRNKTYVCRHPELKLKREKVSSSMIKLKKILGDKK